MGMFDSLEISASGMTAQQEQMNLIASNIANINTTHTVAGGPYQRQVALFTEKRDFEKQFLVPAAFGSEFDADDDDQEVLGSGVQVTGVAHDPAPSKRVYDPSNPDADAQGYVQMPNVDLITEMTGMIQASRAFEANTIAIESSKAMYSKDLQILST